MPIRRTITILLATTAVACAPEKSTDPGPIDRLPRELSVAEREVIGHANAFGFALLSRVAADEAGPNIVLSPLSASMALGMLLNGASGETFDEMRRALALEGMERQPINASYASLIDLLEGLDPAVRFEIANSVWARQGFPFHESFSDTVRDYFDAGVETIDFAAPDAPARINEWVARATGGRIEEMIERIDPMDVMFLLNAIHFDGDWTTPFDPERTSPAEFRTRDGGTVRVPMMSMDEKPHRFAQREDGTKALELPYGGGAFSMVFVQPPGDAFEYARGLTGADWDALVGALDTLEVLVRMPKYELRYQRTLNDDLQALGMVQAFDEADADFERLTAERVYVSEVRQKAFLRLDEQGTEAAAVTSVGVRTVSLGPHIFLDRPFVFAIRERLSGTLLFLGVIGDPTAAGE